MKREVLNEREFELINIIGQEIGANQRQISRMIDMSLGMVNMLIKRLISKGYIRIEQLNKRKVNYILTPKGFREKMQQSVRYTLKTINSISLIKNNVKAFIKDLYAKGHRDFFIYSEADLAMVVDKAFSELRLEGCSKYVLKDLPSEKIEGILLIGKEDIDSGINTINSINLIEEISKDSSFTVV